MTKETVTVEEMCSSSLYGLHFGCKVWKFVDNSEAAGAILKWYVRDTHSYVVRHRTEEPKTSW